MKSKAMLKDYFKAITEQENERELRSQLQSAAEVVFAKVWDNERDEVWNEYLFSSRSLQRLRI